MKRVQNYLECLSRASYLIGDQTAGVAAVGAEQQARVLRASGFGDGSDLTGGNQAWRVP